VYRAIAQAYRGKTRWLAAVFGAALLLALLVGAPVVSAQDPTAYVEGLENVSCLGLPSNACSANDVDIALISVLGTPVCKDDGTGTLWADVSFKAEFDPNRSSTYDIGLWISLNGGNAKTDTTSTCYHGILTPLETTENPFDAVYKDGPFRDLDGDYCGDLVENDGTVYGYVQELRVKCVDGIPADGIMDYISVCTSWDINNQSVCNKVQDAYPGNTAKCHCESAPITPGIPLQQIVVRKVTDPSPDPYDASFNFTVSGTGATPNPPNNVFSLKDQGGWNSGPLVAGGTYSVVESTPPTGWTQTSVVCSDGVNTYNPAGFTMPQNKSVECVFTNTIQRGRIKVDKVTYPAGAQDEFPFTLTGGPAGYILDRSFTLTDAQDPYDSGLILPTTSTGTYNIAETELIDWDMWFAECDDGSPVNAVTLAPGETVICTFYNAMPTAVEVSSFTATAAKNGIALNWETANEIDNRGFNLYRATSAGGEKTQVNAALIASKTYPGSPKGAAYSYTDKTAQRGVTYYYWLEDVEFDGSTGLTGPISAALGNSFRIVLPWGVD